MDIFLVIMHCLIASVVSNALYLDQYYVTELFLICFFPQEEVASAWTPLGLQVEKEMMGVGVKIFWRWN